MAESEIAGNFDFDLLVVGGGINGAGIARDAAGRGLSVLLVEKDDLAAHTSSASTKLIHGGLRYLERFEFRLVRESLMERERLWRMAPHIIWPLRFVVPQTHSPRPAWLVRLGLFLYDHLGGRKKLPPTNIVQLDSDPIGRGLKPGKNKAFLYSDCCVQDSRLVVLNAVDAAERGAEVMTQTRFIEAHRQGTAWVATIAGKTGERRIIVRALVNAAGPWVADVLAKAMNAERSRHIRLIKGSHIVVPRLYDGEHAFLLQNPDRRIVFAIPYEGEFTLIGTTEEAWDRPPGTAMISEHEVAYLLETIGRYFTSPPARASIVWTYAGIRPLYEDHARSASAVTRDYVLDLDAAPGQAPMLNIFGGKITTYRKLAERALAGLAPYFPKMGPAWTADAVLPGGDMRDADFEAYLAGFVGAHTSLPKPLLDRLARAYGTRAEQVLGDSIAVDDLGRNFGADLYRREIDYLFEHEWARTAEDILFRRTKLALHVPPAAASAIDAYLAELLEASNPSAARV